MEYQKSPRWPQYSSPDHGLYKFSSFYHAPTELLVIWGGGHRLLNWGFLYYVYPPPQQATFMTHIVGHKTEKDSIQCADCGTCFAAEPSLRRHLIVAHKIRDFNSYLSRIAEVSRSLDRKSARNRAEEASRRSSPSSVASSDGGGPKECTVCYKPFESDAALKTHMRTHGMAFIRSKRFSIDN